ncbi:MAG: hypothetical protein HXS48_21045 [Theionarchaea archaeon]|nr:MAG: hypothetical protein AYK19_05910 [Theionarchaea archaeon DG-70-1]MBU7029435.1 hypothetical protein [Theionarchaea archaeon]
MKKVVLTTLVFMVLLASKGRVAWYGEKEFESSVKSLEEEGYTVKYISTIDEETLSVYDVLVICVAEPTQEQRDVILDFVEKGGGLLIIYNVIAYPNVEDVFAEYNLEKPPDIETGSDIIFPFLEKDTVEEMRKRIAVSQKGRGRIITVGYDPLTFQTVSLLLDVDSIFNFAMSWLCQDWHVERTQKVLARRRFAFLVLVVVVAAGLAAGYYLFRKRKGKRKESDKSEQIRELKAKFVYGELSKDEYQKELEKVLDEGKG